MACSCKWNSRPPAAPNPPADTPPAPGNPTISYDEQTEDLTIEVTLNGKFTTSPDEAKGAVVIKSVARLTVFAVVSGAWQRVFRESRLKDQERRFECGQAEKQHDWTFPVKATFQFDAAFLAGEEALLLVSYYHKTEGCDKPVGEATVMRRVGVTIQLGPPRQVQSQVTGGAWGPGNTDADWKDKFPKPGDP